MVGSIHAELIYNYNNRLEKLIPMFKSMASQNYGKIEGDFFIIKSELNINPNNENEFIFANIQRNTQLKRIPIVCYSLKNTEQ